MPSKRLQSIQPSATLVLSAKAKALQAAGEDVLNFTAGEPDFEVASHIRKAAHAAIDSNDSYYTPIIGMTELRAAVVDKLKRENTVHVDIENVIITNGGKEALFLLFEALLEQGDEVIIPAPYWVSYVEQVKFSGGVPVILQTDEHFHFTAEDVREVVTEKTKAIVVNSPSNPTGAVVHPNELSNIAALAKELDFFVVSDEVYEHFLYGNREMMSIASLDGMADRTVVINAVSKTYCMTGWRVGYAAGPADLVEAMYLLKSHVSSNTSNIIQRAAIAALTGPQNQVLEMKKTFEERMKVLTKLTNAIDGCSLAEPEGAFYGFIDCRGVMERKGITGSFELCDRLLDEVKVAVVPGAAFGEDYDTFVRFTFSSSLDDIKKGIQRIAEFAK